MSEVSPYPDLPSLLQRVPVDRRDSLRAFWENAIAEHADTKAAHHALVSSASGLRGAILRLHAPLVARHGKELTCAGCCELEWVETMPTPFPCPTYELARDWSGDV